MIMTEAIFISEQCMTDCFEFWNGIISHKEQMGAHHPYVKLVNLGRCKYQYPGISDSSPRIHYRSLALVAELAVDIVGSGKDQRV